MSRSRNKKLLTASEIARYVYCQRAWAYDRQIIRKRQRLERRLFMVAFALTGLAIVLGAILMV
ncbi:MAG: hypothetical protein GYB66_02625 [Chloroflexi bacterium]|nr:hypothetical protein [Chloroflexota bacterium]